MLKIRNIYWHREGRGGGVTWTYLMIFFFKHRHQFDLNNKMLFGDKVFDNCRKNNKPLYIYISLPNCSHTFSYSSASSKLYTPLKFTTDIIGQFVSQNIRAIKERLRTKGGVQLTFNLIFFNRLYEFVSRTKPRPAYVSLLTW